MQNWPLAPVKYAQAATKSVANHRQNLKRRTWLAQENQLFRAGGAPQNRVAVRVAAKAVDDGFVAQLEVQIAFDARLRNSRDRLRMHPSGRKLWCQRLAASMSCQALSACWRKACQSPVSQRWRPRSA